MCGFGWNEAKYLARLPTKVTEVFLAICVSGSMGTDLDRRCRRHLLLRNIMKCNLSKML